MTNLETLLCGNAQISTLDLTNNPRLNRLHCESNKLTSLNLSKNPLITWLTCERNQLTSLDVSSLSVLTHMRCNDNALQYLNVANGNNNNFVSSYPSNPSASPAFDSRNNPHLTCINVDDPTYSMFNWTAIGGFFIDPQQYYNSNCVK